MPEESNDQISDQISNPQEAREGKPKTTARISLKEAIQNVQEFGSLRRKYEKEIQELEQSGKACDPEELDRARLRQDMLCGAIDWNELYIKYFKPRTPQEYYQKYAFMSDIHDKIVFA